MDDAGLHAFHASELPYVFGTFDSTPPRWPQVQASDRGPSDAMIGYWTSFAKSGKPIAAGAPDWRAYGRTGAYLHITAKSRIETGLMPGMYALNEAVVCRRRAAGKNGWNWNVGLNAPKLPQRSPGCG